MSLALDALLIQLRKQRFSVTDAPRAGRARKPGTRYIPAAAKREVWERDGERCAFVSDAGRRCTETRWLELHHVSPHARGGAAVAPNLQLMCRAHNEHLAEVDFGVDYIRHVKADAVRARGAVPAALIRDATSALRQLGFSASVSRGATAAAAAQLAHAGSLEQLIRDSLRRAASLATGGASSAREPVALYEHKPRRSYLHRFEPASPAAAQQHHDRAATCRDCLSVPQASSPRW